MLCRCLKSSAGLCVDNHHPHSFRPQGFDRFAMMDWSRNICGFSCDRILKRKSSTARDKSKEFKNLYISAVPGEPKEGKGVLRGWSLCYPEGLGQLGSVIHRGWESWDSPAWGRGCTKRALPTVSMFQLGRNEGKGAELLLVVLSSRSPLEFRAEKNLHSESEGMADGGVCVTGDVENPAECGGPCFEQGLGHLQRSFPNSCDIKEFGFN